MLSTLSVLAADAASEALEEGNAFWLPHDINEVIWGSLAFFIVAYLLWKFGRKPTVDMFKKRSATVASDLDAAAGARTEAEAERDRIKTALADSDSEAARILEEARASAAQLEIDTAARAQFDAERVRERGAAELLNTRAQAQTDLAGELSRLSLGAAERVVEKSLDGATQQRLIDEYISQVGSQN